eukprot:TRINITY_DN28268_c0_g1_i1.p1 TRINITY_DN28268_c0_g1~~TRINITY_DN28268_c0_g1_i1.p1  ORF type:complete len:165 (-),score=35.53 TRINITY_DN28268_c0_g1_i1:17-511(-)
MKQMEENDKTKNPCLSPERPCCPSPERPYLSPEKTYPSLERPSPEKPCYSPKKRKVQEDSDSDSLELSTTPNQLFETLKVDLATIDTTWLIIDAKYRKRRNELREKRTETAKLLEMLGIVVEPPPSELYTQQFSFEQSVPTHPVPPPLVSQGPKSTSTINFLLN